MNIKGASLKEIEQEQIKLYLEHLEKLEKENKEYKKLTEKVINAFQISNKNLTNEINKLKMVIKILKSVLQFPMVNDFWVDRNDNRHYRVYTKRMLTEEEYDLLKEVLE